MTTDLNIDPELRDSMEFVNRELGHDFMSTMDAPRRRQRFAEFLQQVSPPEPPFPDVLREEATAPGFEQGPGVPVRVFRPRDPRPAASGGLLYMHGGGFTLGSPATEDANAAALSEALRCTVVSVDYRLAPEHHHPAPVQDCYAALAWFAEHADELGVDPHLIVVYGHSGGAGLAANVAIMARDLEGPSIALQMLCYPMLDDRMKASTLSTLNGAGVFDTAAVRTAWQSLLGGKDAAEHPPYGAAARCANLQHLPAAYIDAGQIEVLLEENLAFAQSLTEAGVPVELHIYPRAYHGFDMFAPHAAVSQQCVQQRIAALRRVFKLPAFGD